MNHKDPTVYEARFSRLRMHAFGMAQILAYTETVQVYQARANPELWRARPVMARGSHKWEATSAEQLMTVIGNDWCDCLIPWHKVVAELPAQRVEDSRTRFRRLARGG
jgi:hypothetical protein